MHNIIVQICMLALALLIAGVKSIDLNPTQLLEHAEDKQKDEDGPSADQQVTALLHLQQVLQSNLLIINLFLLALLATADYSIFQIVAFAFLWLVGVYLLAATAFVQKRAQAYTRKHLSGLLRLAAGLEPALKVLDDSRFLSMKRDRTFYTRGELLKAALDSKGILTKDEKRQLRALLAEPAAHTTAELPDNS